VSYKIGFILSLFFVFQIIMLVGDIFSLQIIHSELDAIAHTVSYRIAKDGNITEATHQWACENYQSQIVCLKNCQPRFGDTLEFKVIRQYQPLIINNQTITVSVKRATVIGYY
jgi:hypothetical protein